MSEKPVVNFPAYTRKPSNKKPVAIRQYRTIGKPGFIGDVQLVDPRRPHLRMVDDDEPPETESPPDPVPPVVPEDVDATVMAALPRRRPGSRARRTEP